MLSIQNFAFKFPNSFSIIIVIIITNNNPNFYKIGNCHYRFILDTIVTLKADWQNMIFNLTNWFGHSYNYIINTSASHPMGNHQDNNFSPRINHQWPLLMDIIATHCFANFSNPKSLQWWLILSSYNGPSSFNSFLQRDRFKLIDGHKRLF